MATLQMCDALVSPSPVSRRTFVLTVAAGVFGLGVIAGIKSGADARSVSSLRLNRDAAAGIEPITNAGALAAWSLSVVRGPVELELTADVLSRFESTTRIFRQVGSARGIYGGVELNDLLAAVGAGTGVGARVVSCVPNGGREISTVLMPSDTAGGMSLIATTCNGRALTAAEGGPARLVYFRQQLNSIIAPLGRVKRIEVLG